MTDDMKAEIRSRMGGSQQYLYRGVDDDSFAAEINRGFIEGGSQTVYNASGDPGGDIQGEEIGRAFASYSVDKYETPITGGVTDELAQTNRFSGASNYAMVLDRSAVPFEPIQYSYKWMNEHKGVYDHLLSASDGELRVRGELRGSIESIPKARGGGRKVKVRHWEKGNSLPGLSSESRFAEESEWVTFDGVVDISDAVVATVSVIEPVSARVTFARGKDMTPGDAPPHTEIIGEVYEDYRDGAPDSVPYYLLVVDDFRSFQNTTYGGWRAADISVAYGPDGRLTASEVPGYVRGEA